MIDILLTNGDVFTMAGDGVGYLENGAVAIDGNRIVAVGPSPELEAKYQARRTIDATMKAVLPGLIDGHLNTVITILRGLGQDAPTWHEGVDPYFEQLTPAAVLAGAQLSAIEAIRAGTTTLGDYGPGMPIALPFYEMLGVRARVCTLISEVPPVESLLREGELYPSDPAIGESRLQENLDLVGQWNGAADGRITTIAEDELLESIQRVSEEVSAQASKEVRKRKTFQHLLTLEDRY